MQEDARWNRPLEVLKVPPHAGADVAASETAIDSSRAPGWRTSTSSTRHALSLIDEALASLSSSAREADARYAAPTEVLADRSRWRVYRNVVCDSCGKTCARCTERPVERGRYCDPCAKKNGAFRVFFDRREGVHVLDVPTCFVCNSTCGSMRMLRAHVASKRHLKALLERHSVSSPAQRDACRIIAAAVANHKQLRRHLPTELVEALPIVSLGPRFQAFEDAVLARASDNRSVGGASAPPPPPHAQPSKAPEDAHAEKALDLVKHIDGEMSEADMELLIRELSEGTVFGLDTETAPPRFFPHVNRFFPGPHLIQIATEHHIWLYSTLTQRMLDTARRLVTHTGEEEQRAHGVQQPSSCTVEGCVPASGAHAVFAFHEEEVELDATSDATSADVDGCSATCGAWRVVSVSTAPCNADDGGSLLQAEKYHQQLEAQRRINEADIAALNSHRMPRFLRDFFRRTDAFVVGFGLQGDRDMILKLMMQAEARRGAAGPNQQEAPVTAAPTLPPISPPGAANASSGIHNDRGEFLLYNSHFIPMVDLGQLLPTEEVAASPLQHSTPAPQPLDSGRDSSRPRTGPSGAQDEGADGNARGWSVAEISPPFDTSGASGASRISLSPLLVPGRSVGTVQVAARVLHRRFVKNKRISVSNWAVPSRRLKSVQLLYAARDAQLPLTIYATLKAMAAAATGPPPPAAVRCGAGGTGPSSAPRSSALVLVRPQRNELTLFQQPG